MIRTRAQAKESVAEVWHQRRQTQQRTSEAAAGSGSVPTPTKTRPTTISGTTTSQTPAAPKYSPGKDTSQNLLKLPKGHTKGLPSLCVLIQKAWDRTGLLNTPQPQKQEGLKKFVNESTTNRYTSKKKSDGGGDNHNDEKQRVFPSILPILQAHALAKQVEYLHDDDAVMQDALLSVFSRDYDFDKAIRQMAQSRNRAFWLIDIAQPVLRLVRWQKKYPPKVRFLYRLSANADAILVRVLTRLDRTGIIVKSNWDLNTAITTFTSSSQSQTKEISSILYDDSTSIHRPDSYLRHAILGRAGGGDDDGQSPIERQLLRVLTVDGPAEVDRIVRAIRRLAARRQIPQPPQVNFLLRLADNVTASTWSSTTANTLDRIHAVGAGLAGISVDLSSSSNRLEEAQSALETLLTTTLVHQTNLRVDITGLDWENSDWWWQRLSQLPNVQEITVDATEPLIGTSGALCTRIIGCKVMSDQRRHYYIDDGCYGSLYQARDTPPLPLGRKSQQESPFEQNSLTTTYQSTVWGPTCDGLDRVCPNVELPALRRDDWLVFPKISGTSGQGLGTAFNGFCPPDTVYCVLGYFK